MDNLWFIRPADLEGQGRLSSAFGIEPVTAQILINRGFKEVEEVKSFLSPDLSSLPDPFFLPDMDRAVDRIVSAIKNNERIALYGDYDVDGITGVALLMRFLRKIGHEPLVFIPNRLSEGYGLHRSALETLKSKGASLVITVDCGVRSKNEIEFALANGMDVIVTDHHESDELPAGYILLNPKRPDAGLKEKEIAGCGVAFFLLTALKKKLGIETDPQEHLDLVALGTIADVVPLTGINRIFAKFGMEEARVSMKPGVRTLINVSGLDGMQLKTGSVAFRMAPRINAAGRMGDAMLSLELLTTDDAALAREIALNLNKLNSDRQRIEEKALYEAIEHIERDNFHKRAAIVVASENWHAGVIGIVASKLVERYALPAVVIAAAEKRAKGSARSVGGLNIVEALGRCADVLERFGGHAQAAGLVVDTARIDSFRSRFEACCAEVSRSKEARRLSIDAEVLPKDISIKLTKEIGMLEPFGLGNPEPVLCVRNLKVASARIVGTNHLKLKLQATESGISFDAIGFGLGEKIPQIGQTVAVAFTPQMNEWNGYELLQLKIKEISCLK